MILQIISIDDLADYSKLGDIIPSSYLPLNLIELFTESLSKRVRSVAVEYPYVDKDYRWIIDATANQYEIYPFLFIHDHNKMYINDRALKRQLFRIFFDTQVQPYELYENNLRRYE